MADGTISTDEPVKFLDLAAQQARLGSALRDRLEAVLAHGQFVLGPEVQELEAALAEFCGAREAVGVSSGTDALQIALMAEEIGRGDAVFLPAFTYTATAEVVLVLGATPIFVDIDPRTFQMDVEDLEESLGRVKRAGQLSPRAVIGVDLFGQPAPWVRLREIAEREGLFTLDDCAQGFGATLHGRLLGTEADATATSFFPSKPLGAYGDGGAIFTQSSEKAALYRSLRSHGEGASRYDVLRTGMNGRLDTLQAAVLLAKLPVFRDELKMRAHLAALYDSRLQGLVDTPFRVADSESAWAVYSILLPDRSTRDHVQACLRSAAIPTAVYYPKPLHHQPAYQCHHDGRVLRIAEDVAQRILALPIHPDLSEASVERVCAALERALSSDPVVKS